MTGDGKAAGTGSPQAGAPEAAPLDAAEELARRLGAHLDGELTDADAAAVEAQLFADPAARALYRGLKADQAALSAELNAATNRPAPDLLAVIDRAFAARAAPRPAARRRWWPQAAAAAAILVVALGGAGWWAEYRIGTAMHRLEARQETVRGEIQAALSRALETQVSGATIAWAGDGISGEVTPIRTYRSASGDWCREYLRSTRMQDREVSVRGLACRNAEGAWVTVKAAPDGAHDGKALSGQGPASRDGAAGHTEL
ncbi:MAG: RT0821/Lpp0805 family surface protein [Sneathiellaceae bacterium]